MADEQNEMVVIDQAAQVLRDDQARLNITWAGNNGDLPEPVSYDATDGDIKTWAAEAVRGGHIPGIPADQGVAFHDFIVDRFPSTQDVAFNRLFLRPKTPFGGARWRPTLRGFLFVHGLIRVPSYNGGAR